MDESGLIGIHNPVGLGDVHKPLDVVQKPCDVVHKPLDVVQKPTDEFPLVLQYSRGGSNSKGWSHIQTKRVF